MKKILIIALCMLYGMGTWAQQGRNARITMGMNNLTYNKPEDKGTLAKVLDALLTGQVSKDQSKYQDAVRAAVVKGLSQSHRIIAIDGQLSKDEAALPNAMYIDGTVSNLSTTSKVLHSISRMPRQMRFLPVRHSISLSGMYLGLRLRKEQ